MEEWVEQETKTAVLGDQRLNQRMKMVLQRLSENPEASPHAAMRGWAEAEGAYRFFDNDKPSAEKILAPHGDATVERVKAFDRVLVLQDTTELDYTKKKRLKGKGPLSTVNRQGFFLHEHLVVTPERLVLGVWGAKIYARDEKEHGKSSSRKQRPIEEKESYRWLEGYRAACDLMERAQDTEVISCSDREGDVYEVFQERQRRTDEGKSAAHWLIRKNQDRVLDGTGGSGVDNGFSEFRTIVERVGANPVLGTITVEVKAKEQLKKVKGGNRVKKKRAARVATLEVRSAQVTLRPPHRTGRKLDKVSFWVVQAKEVNPPKNDDPIEWVLMTSLKAAGFQRAVTIIELYRVRWEIEVFHRVLKTGCTVEQLELKDDERIKVALALYLIVAWRVLYVMRLGRECPDVPCNLIFEEDEWKALWFVEYGPKAMTAPPTLKEFIRILAKIGGFKGRKGDGEPGPQTIWQGLSCLRGMVLFRQAFLTNQPSLRDSIG
jgi:hypothetical protein